MKSQGVTFYAHGKLVYDVAFANGEINCYNCPFLYSEYGLDRPRCRITGEILHYPRTELGNKCPITFEEGKKET